MNLSSTTIKKGGGTELRFRIQQLGSAQRGFAGVKYTIEYTKNTGAPAIYRREYGPISVNATPNASTEVIHDLKPFTSMPFGSYTARVIVDFNETQVDLNRNNNSTAISSFVNYVPAIDYALSTFLLESTTTGGGAFLDQTIEVQTSIRNEGDLIDMPSNKVQFYLVPFKSSAAIGDPDTVFLGERFSPSVSVAAQLNGSRSVVTETFTLPSGLPLLNYFVAARVNSDLSISEIDPFNNIAFSFLRVTVERVRQRPDLTPNQLSILETTAQVGDTITLSGRIANNTEFPSFDATLIHHELALASAPQIRYPLGVRFFSVINGRPPGAAISRSYTASFTVPDGLPSGDYLYFAEIDRSNIVAEFNETNNDTLSSDTITITAMPRPNLRSVDDPIAPAT